MGAEFYREVPFTLQENLEYRIELRERSAKDAGFRRAMRQASAEDVVFWFSAFCWLYEPRVRFDSSGNRLPKVIPFIPWEHQIPHIIDLREKLGLCDIDVYKSRAEGISWIMDLLALHDWCFDEMAKVGIVSNKEKNADDPGNMDSLMAKLDWELTKLPRWMVGVEGRDWTRNKAEHSLVNHRNGSQINAFAATKDAGRSGRYKWFFADEIAFWDPKKDKEFLTAVAGSTESIACVSTPNGTANEFYKRVHGSSGHKIRIHWTQNQAKNSGLYKIIDGKAVAVDSDNPLHPSYEQPSQDVLDLWSRLRAKGFKLEGSFRSPWYDQECDRSGATPKTIAQEHDLDFGGSKSRPFLKDFFDATKGTVLQPFSSGRLMVNPETMAAEFVEEHEGPLKLWCHLDSHGRPSQHRYVIGCDIGSGLGGSHTSNSVAQVIDLVTMEQVAELATNTVEPSEFAELCVALAKLFHGAYLGWESNYGGGFTKRVKELQYADVYYRTVHWKGGGDEKTKEVGWWTDDRTKELMFSDLYRKVKNGELILRSMALERECGEYVINNQKIIHESSADSDDESSTGKMHGDRVIGIAVAVQLAKERRPSEQSAEEFEQESAEPPPNSLAWRIRYWEQQERDRMGWDSRTGSDYADGGFDGFVDSHMDKRFTTFAQGADFRLF